MHSRMHKYHYDNTFRYKCPIPNCQSSFTGKYLLNLHLRVHNNDFDRCRYCPFKYIVPLDYQKHLKKHFGIKDFECDQCDKVFLSIGQLNKHYEIHEGIKHHCLLCDGYHASNKSTILMHLQAKHGEIIGEHLIWDSVKVYIKTEKLLSNGFADF